MRPVFIAEFPTEFSAPGPRDPSSSADYNRKVVYADENEGSFAGSNEEEERGKKGRNEFTSFDMREESFEFDLPLLPSPRFL